jgi:hypothetical protein
MAVVASVPPPAAMLLTPPVISVNARLPHALTMSVGCGRPSPTASSDAEGLAPAPEGCTKQTAATHNNTKTAASTTWFDLSVSIDHSRQVAAM